MKSHLKSYTLLRLLQPAAKRFGKEIQRDCQKHSIYLTDGPNHGTLAVYDFEDGVQMLMLDGALPEDWDITITSKAESPFLLYFNIRGTVGFQYGGLEEATKIEPMKALMAAHPKGQTQRVFLKNGEQMGFVWLLLERRLYINHIGCLPEAVKEEVVAIFDGQTAVKTFQNSVYGLKGAALFQRVLDDPKDGLAHSTFAESKALELLSLQLRRWEEDICGPSAKPNLLRSDDVEKIIMARNLLLADLQNAPTIEVLSKRSGVNRQKLKKGFKIVFGKTINEYLRNERLKRAKQLLAQGQPVIKEVASQVGYENASYFARRFKEQFGVYPNEYMAVMADVEEEE